MSLKVKIASVIDWAKSGLDQAVFDKNDKMVKGVKDKILSMLYDKLKEKGYKHYDEWIKIIKLVGSMTTYRYADNSDLDIHVVVDLDGFIDLEHSGDVNYTEASEILDVIKRELNEKIVLVDKSRHAIEYYFEGFYKDKTVQFSLGPGGSIKDLKEI